MLCIFLRKSKEVHIQRASFLHFAILQYPFELLRTSLTYFQTQMVQSADKDWQMAWVAHVTLLSGSVVFQSSPADTCEQLS